MIKMRSHFFFQYQKENLENSVRITTRFGNVLGSNGSVVPYSEDKLNREVQLQLPIPK